MIAYIDSAGKIIGGCAGNSPDALKGITYISGGTYAVYIDETQYPNVVSDMGEYVIGSIVPTEVYYVPTATGVPIYTPIPDSIKLASAQQAKIQQVSNSYLIELNSTFSSSATGTALVYGYSLNSQNLWKELSESLNGGYIPDSMFPMNITLHDGSVVPHTKLQLQQVFGEITTRKLTLYQKLQNMITVNGTIMSCTTVNAVNAIVW